MSNGKIEKWVFDNVPLLLIILFVLFVVGGIL